MAVEEEKETLREIDKMMLDSVKLISEAKDHAEGQILTRFMTDMLKERGNQLKKLDRLEVSSNSEMPDNQQVGGSVQALVLDEDLSDKEILREVLNGDQDLLEAMEKEMAKPMSDDMKSVLDECSREMIRNTEVMKKMINKNEV